MSWQRCSTDSTNDRYVLIAGPSGAGKSALLWRAARNVGRAARNLRVHRLRNDVDVDLLLRHIRLQEPSNEVPLLVCADDLGRPPLAKFGDAAARLLEIDGVLVLGAVRQEDFRPALVRGRALVVQPRLDGGLATDLAVRLQADEVDLRLDPAEASARAEGLLMEYIALLTTGRRLSAVLAAQVDELREPSRAVQRSAARPQWPEQSKPSATRSQCSPRNTSSSRSKMAIDGPACTSCDPPN